MKDFYKYRALAIVCMIASICFFSIFFIANNNERNRFMNFNRSTIPDYELEKIKSPTSLTLSFNEYYHLDSIQWHDEYGNQIINIPTVNVGGYNDDWSKITADNYGMESPYHWPLDNKQFSIIHAMEVLANCNFGSYQKSMAPTPVTVNDYIESGLIDIFYENVYKPLLREMFNQVFYVRPSSPKSIIKAIGLNQVGRISIIYLYNGITFRFDEISGLPLNKTQKDLFQTSIDEKSRKDLIDSYEDRLSLRSLTDHRKEAEFLADKHIEEIKNTLLTEKIEFLGQYDYKFIATYPKWIDWLLECAYCTLFMFIFFAIIAYIKRKTYLRLQCKLSQIQMNFPNASRKYNLPFTITTSNSEIEQILNRDFSVWKKEEQDLIEKQRQMQIVAKKVSELKNLYPNGWNIVQAEHPHYSNANMFFAENRIIEEENKYQKEKEATHLAKLEKIKQENETVENELQLLTQATQVGDVEMAEEKIKALKNAAKSQTVDLELVKAINTKENEFNCKYSEGITDTFEISHVDYTIPSNFVQGDIWTYVVAKFPSKGTLVFPYRRRKIARRGYMEHTFQIYLANMLSKFKLLVLGDCALLPADNYRPYEPDIAIIDVERPAIRIDIEIDEPYSAISKKPIHYLGCGDDFRDLNLNNLGWIVVRFTEYQVKFDMQGCTSFIAQLIRLLNPQKFLLESLLKQKYPSIQKRWTEIESKVMASEKYREKYLNHEFDAVDSEQIEFADIKQTEKERSCARLVKPLIIESQYLDKQKNIGISVCFERDNCIQFLPQEHIYIYDGQEQLFPVSSVVSCFFKQFDSYYWSKYKANQRNVPQGLVLEEWDAKGACSREVGTFMHQQIENYYYGLPYQQDFLFKYKGKYVQINEQINLHYEYMQFMDFLKNHRLNPFRTEWTIYDEELKIAGTIDMLLKNGDVFDIYDWKRSHRIVDVMGNPITINSYGDTGLGELCQIEDTPYWHYCIQQNLYRYIVEKNYGIKIENMYLIVFCDDANGYCKLEVPHMDEVIVSIVKGCQNGTVKKRLMSLQGENLS